MVALCCGGVLFVGYDGGEGGVYFVEEGGVGVEVFGDEDAWTGEEDVVPFVLEGGELCG